MAVTGEALRVTGTRPRTTRAPTTPRVASSQLPPRRTRAHVRRTLVAMLAAASLGVVFLAHPAAAQVTVEAQVSRHTVPLGESATLEVTVHGAGGGVAEPAFEPPANLDVTSSGRSQSFSWVNGKSSSEVAFRYELVPHVAGTYTVGPIQVRVGDQAYLCPAFTITALAGQAPGPGAGGGQPNVMPETARGANAPAALLVEVNPRDPWVGQPALLRVRLVQRTPLAEDPRYSPPPTPGFWAERPSEPESYYGVQSGARVLVTETRTRLYPLAAGNQTVGAASAMLVVEAGGTPFDPFGWFGGSSRRQLEIQSPPVAVHVRPLPASAPAGFGGAVGTLVQRFSVDRARTPQDQPVTVRLDVRGSGNLPLIKTPEFQPPGFEVFGSTVDDSLGAPGTVAPGRRSFRWTVLPRSVGTLTLVPPPFAWFDPRTGGYRVAELAPLTVEVTAAAAPNAAQSSAMRPEVFDEHPLDPGARPAEPWRAAVAGACLAWAIMLLRPAERRSGAQDRDAVDRLVAALRAATGDSLWLAADRACEWLAARGTDVAGLRAEVAAARYGGARVNPEPVRVKLLQALATAPGGSAPPAWLRPAAGAALAIVAAGCAVWALPGGWPGADLRALALRPAAAAAAQRARASDLAGAERGWRELWHQGVRSPGLAARLAWCRLEDEDVAAASLWVLRGERDDARDPVLEWVKQRVREAGGLAGATPPAVPVRRVEWVMLALAAGLAGGWLWLRRAAAAVCAVLLLACAAAVPVRDALVAGRNEAVVMREVRLGGSDIDLEPGRVVRDRGARGGREQVWVGPGVEGWLPPDVLRRVASL